MRLACLSATTATLLVLVAGTLNAAPKPPVSFAAQIQPILDDNCVACHQAGSAQQGFILEQGKSFAMLVGASREASMPRVTPGKPEASYLMAKLSGTQKEAGGKGARMPLGSALDAASIALIQRWIAEGAYDN